MKRTYPRLVRVVMAASFTLWGATPAQTKIKVTCSNTMGGTCEENYTRQ